jgi:hypothetical protein
MKDNGNNKWENMKAAEWRGKVGEKLERVESLVDAICAKVDAHDRALAVLEDRGVRARLGTVARATITAAAIAAITSVIVAVIALFH